MIDTDCTNDSLLFFIADQIQSTNNYQNRNTHPCIPKSFRQLVRNRGRCPCERATDLLRTHGAREISST